jgi:hypothetical protein
MTLSALTMAPPPPAPPTKTALHLGGDLIFPVGFDLGPFYPAPGEPLAYYEICVGHTSYTLPSEADYRVWTAAHEAPEQAPLTWPTYRDRLIEAGIADAGALARRLVDNGLLWSISANGDDAVSFVRTHRLLPLATAIGEAEIEVPVGTYALGLPRGPYYFASEIEYWLWLWGASWDSLWVACEMLAGRPVEKGGGIDPLSCVGTVLLAAQALIGNSVAFLDAAWDRR